MKLLNFQTKDILTSLWYQVEALAEALLERRSLNRQEVRKVIRDAMTDEMERFSNSLAPSNG